MTTDTRCDLGMSNGKRCRNDGAYWVVTTIDLSATKPPEQWPLVVCEAHYEALHDGKRHNIHRMGPDRRQEYANRERAAMVGEGE
jgi:hypothetical protein